MQFSYVFSKAMEAGWWLLIWLFFMGGLLGTLGGRGARVNVVK